MLINRYSDVSSEELLFNKLSVCYQKANQSFENYADEIKLRLNRLKDLLVFTGNLSKIMQNYLNLSPTHSRKKQR